MISEEQNDVIMAGNEMSMTENEDAEITVIESSEVVSLLPLVTPQEVQIHSLKSHRSVVWCYFDKDSGKKSKSMLCREILKNCGNTINLFEVTKNTATCSMTVSYNC